MADPSNRAQNLTFQIAISQEPLYQFLKNEIDLQSSQQDLSNGTSLVRKRLGGG